MNLTVTQTVTELNLTASQDGVSVKLQPVISVGGEVSSINGGTP